jgi:hypothetical protein
MFDWFKRPDYSNVIKFPEPKAVPPVPYIEQPKPEETYYSIGITSENRVTLRMGYSTLTMNHKGCEDLIEQLEVFMKQIKEEETDA